MRLFVAIHPDAATQSWIAGAQERLRKALGRWAERDLRWVDPSQIHVTLVFLGELPDAAAAEACLKPCSFTPMELTVGGLGVFPNARRPSVLWIGIRDASGELARLQAGITQALSSLLEPERRRFEPHLTLARVRPRARLRLDLEKLNLGEAPQPWRVKEFNLMQSHQDPHGMRHTVVRRFRGT